MILFILMCLACVFFGWTLADFVKSAVAYFKVIKEVKAWKALKAGR